MTLEALGAQTIELPFFASPWLGENSSDDHVEPVTIKCDDGGHGCRVHLIPGNTFRIGSAEFTIQARGEGEIQVQSSPAVIEAQEIEEVMALEHVSKETEFQATRQGALNSSVGTQSSMLFTPNPQSTVECVEETPAISTRFTNANDLSDAARRRVFTHKHSRARVEEKASSNEEVQVGNLELGETMEEEPHAALLSFTAVDAISDPKNRLDSKIAGNEAPFEPDFLPYGFEDELPARKKIKKEDATAYLSLLRSEDRPLQSIEDAEGKSPEAREMTASLFPALDPNESQPYTLSPSEVTVIPNHETVDDTMNKIPDPMDGVLGDAWIRDPGEVGLKEYETQDSDAIPDSEDEEGSTISVISGNRPKIPSERPRVTDGHSSNAKPSESELVAISDHATTQPNKKRGRRTKALETSEKTSSVKKRRRQPLSQQSVNSFVNPINNKKRILSTPECSQTSRHASLTPEEPAASTGLESLLPLAGSGGNAYKGDPPKVCFTSGSMVSENPMSAFVKFLQAQQGRKVETITEDTNVLCIGTNELKKTAKFIKSVALGIDIVTDKWLNESSAARYLLDVAPFLPQDPANEALWGFTLRDAIARGKAGVRAFQGVSVIFSTSLWKELKGAAREMESIARAAGAIKVLTRTPKEGPIADDPTTVVLATENDKDAEAMRTLGWTLYGKDFLSLSVLRGRIDLESDEFQLGIEAKKTTMNQRRRAR